MVNWKRLSAADALELGNCIMVKVVENAKANTLKTKFEELRREAEEAYEIIRKVRFFRFHQNEINVGQYGTISSNGVWETYESRHVFSAKVFRIKCTPNEIFELFCAAARVEAGFDEPSYFDEINMPNCGYITAVVWTDAGMKFKLARDFRDLVKELTKA